MDSSLFRPVINLGNSIVGVSILTMPWCFTQCGVVLGTLLLLLSALFTTWTCKMLLRTAHMTRQHTYETLGLAVYSSVGKLGIELSNIGLGVGTCVAFYIIIGDLLSPLVAASLGLDWDPSLLRGVLLVFSGVCVAFPLTLIRNVDRLSVISIGSLAFYLFVIVQLVFLSLSNLAGGVWSKVVWWRFGGIFKCLPIFSLAFCCQSQMFVIYTSLREGSVRKMSTVVDGAVGMVTTAYLLVAWFGYLTFCTVDIHGDVLANFSLDSLSQLTRFGFAVTVMLSFPLIVFPCRVSINSLLFPEKEGQLAVTPPIPQSRFIAITASVMLSTLVLAILIPNIQTVLALVGATLGSLICFIFPGMFFGKVAGSNADYSARAKFCIGLGLTVLVISTFVTLNSWSEEAAVEYHIQPPSHQLDIVKLPPGIPDKNSPPLEKQKSREAVPEIDAQDKVNLEPPIDLKNVDSAPNDAQPVVKEMNEKVHEKLEEKISKLEKKVDALKEDIREKQEEIDKDHKSLNNDKTPVEVKGQEEAKVEEPVDKPVPPNDFVELKSGGGVADKHPSHVIKDPDHVIKDPDHVIKDPDRVIKDPVQEANGNAPEINQVAQEAIKQDADNVGVANPVGVAQPADKLDTKLEKVKEMNVENKELNVENIDFKSLESNRGHLAAVRDLKSKP